MKNIMGMNFIKADSGSAEHDVYSSQGKNKYGYHVTLKFTKDERKSSETEEKLKNAILREIL
ncbi:hypothetical protein [Halalkalibacterium halodurans]|uniref:hypothetical protein n=1 Tax=Halalkalibacterium halodurans TaxID=86665 RepID=UPI002AAA28FA|nr:hypothetical protein [Halalkalibacterium halodurans]MDY7222120.1 hypothetical protein [Halalkalibacterium halodurans]MDY7243922.1 hypothetical protein [Halalkalibacterium halodurans]